MNFIASLPSQAEFAAAASDGGDFGRFRRKSCDGLRWVAECPGEPANNYWVKDPVAVAILDRRLAGRG